jgi:sec-independent protein translocase protein TatC
MSTHTPDEEAEIEASKAPLLEHLVELRKRLVWSLLAFGICFVFCFFFARDIFGFLTIPLGHALEGRPNHHLIATALTETFFTYAKLGMFGGLFLAFPVVAAQLWLFIAPGLYRKERRAFLPFLIASPVLFIMGAAFVFYIMLPFGIKFLVSFDTGGAGDALGIQLQAKVSEYLDFVMTLIFAFGITFQLPVLLSLLGKVGILSSAQLRAWRRYAIVGIAALAAVFTPPDAFSMLSLIIPLYLLYEASIISVWLIERGRAKDAAAS